MCVKNIRELIIYLIVFIAIIVLAVAGYNYLVSKSSITPDGESLQQNTEKPAPDFTVTDKDGNKVSLSDFGGKPVVINFWATWCGPCRSEMPAFEELYAKYGDEVSFVMINVDGTGTQMSDIAPFLQDAGYTFPVYIDSDFSASRSYNAHSIPLSVFVDKNGNITATHVGAMSKETIENYIQSAMKE